MNPRVQSVSTTHPRLLRLTFTNGEEGVYDCTSLLNFGVFKELRDSHYFDQASVMDGTVTWPHEQDICPDTLYIDSIKIKSWRASVDRVKGTPTFKEFSGSVQLFRVSSNMGPFQGQF